MKFRVLSKDLPRQRHLRMSVQLALALSGLLLEAAAKTGANGVEAGWNDDIEKELNDVLKIGLRVSLSLSFPFFVIILIWIVVFKFHCRRCGGRSKKRGTLPPVACGEHGTAKCLSLRDA
jgi:hypothetical protein